MSPLKRYSILQHLCVPLGVAALALLLAQPASAQNLCATKAALINPLAAVSSGIGGTGAALENGGIGGTGMLAGKPGIGGTGSREGGVGGLPVSASTVSKCILMPTRRSLKTGSLAQRSNWRSVRSSQYVPTEPAAKFQPAVSP